MNTALFSPVAARQIPTLSFGMLNTSIPARSFNNAGDLFMMAPAKPWSGLAYPQNRFAIFAANSKDAGKHDKTEQPKEEKGTPIAPRPTTMNPDGFPFMDMPLGIHSYDGWVPLSE